MPIDCSRGAIDPDAPEDSAPDMSAVIMPYKKGDLFIKFNIQFPTGIADDKRQKIVELLRKNKEELE